MGIIYIFQIFLGKLIQKINNIHTHRLEIVLHNEKDTLFFVIRYSIFHILRLLIKIWKNEILSENRNNMSRWRILLHSVQLAKIQLVLLTYWENMLVTLNFEVKQCFFFENR